MEQIECMRLFYYASEILLMDKQQWDNICDQVKKELKIKLLQGDVQWKEYTELVAGVNKMHDEYCDAFPHLAGANKNKGDLKNA